jgi:hypothetical protein
MLSGRRDLGYGGIAYVGGTCDPGRTQGITGFLTARFSVRRPAKSGQLGRHRSDPRDGPQRGTFHTHDGISRPSTTAATAFPRGTIMSYYASRRRAQHRHGCTGKLRTIEADLARRLLRIRLQRQQRGRRRRYCRPPAMTSTTESLTASGLQHNALKTLAAGGCQRQRHPHSCEPDCNSNGIPDPLNATLTLHRPRRRQHARQCQAIATTTPCPTFDVRPGGGLLTSTATNA